MNVWPPLAMPTNAGSDIRARGRRKPNVEPSKPDVGSDRPSRLLVRDNETRKKSGQYRVASRF